LACQSTLDQFDRLSNPAGLYGLQIVWLIDKNISEGGGDFSSPALSKII